VGSDWCCCCCAWSDLLRVEDRIAEAEKSLAKARAMEDKLKKLYDTVGSVRASSMMVMMLFTVIIMMVVVVIIAKQVMSMTTTAPAATPTSMM
jgi:hypothetical protein